MLYDLRIAKRHNILWHIDLKNVNQLVQRNPTHVAMNTAQSVSRIEHTSIVSLLLLDSRLPNFNRNVGRHGRPPQLVDSESPENGTNVTVVDERVRVDVFLRFARNSLQTTNDLTNEEAFGDLNVLCYLTVVAPVVVPLPIACPENFFGLLLRNTLGCVGKTAWEFISVAEAGLEVVGKVVKCALPGAAGGAEDVSQRLPQLGCYVEMLVPIIGRLN